VGPERARRDLNRSEPTPSWSRRPQDGGSVYGASDAEGSDEDVPILVTVAALATTTLAFAGVRVAIAQESSPSPGPIVAGECVGCHAHPEIQIADDGEYRPDIYVMPEDIAGSVHGDFACIECHSTLKSTMHAKKDAARESCADCHDQQHEEYEAGYHGTSGEGPRPTCITCHGSHDVQDASTRDFVHRAAEQCARCHEQMNERFMGGTRSAWRRTWPARTWRRAPTVTATTRCCPPRTPTPP